MANGDVPSFERLLGRLEEAIRELKTQVPAIRTEMDRQRELQAAECDRHWVATRSLTSSLNTLVADAKERKAQRYWVIERLLQGLPVVYAAIVGILGYLVVTPR